MQSSVVRFETAPAVSRSFYRGLFFALLLAVPLWSAIVAAVCWWVG